MAPLDAKSLFAALDTAEVRFIVVGGFAVSAHGYLRGTKDLDIVPDPDPENLRRLAGALSRLDAEVMGMEEFSQEEKVVQPDVAGLAMGRNFVLTTDYGRLDILQVVSPDFEYHDLDAAAIEDEVLGHRVRFCGYEDLVKMKQAAGRLEDELDLKRLRAVRGESLDA